MYVHIHADETYFEKQYEYGLTQLLNLSNVMLNALRANLEVLLYLVEYYDIPEQGSGSVTQDGVADLAVAGWVHWLACVPEAGVLDGRTQGWL